MKKKIKNILLKDLSDHDLSSHGKSAKLFALLTIIAVILALYVANVADHAPRFEENTPRYILENTATALMVASVIFAFTVKQIQKSVYWLFWLKLDRTVPDERQKIVKQKVFEQSYGYVLLILYIGISLISENTTSRLRNMIFFAILMIAISLPSILAAWRKDS